MFKNLSLKTRFLWMIVVTLAAALGTLFFITGALQDRILEFEISKDLLQAEKSFQNLLAQDEKMLRASLESFIQNEEYKKIFLSGDREKLYAGVAPLFESLKENYGVTHLYFISLDGRVFLRTHAKELFGDEISRTTFRQAAALQKISSGVELGKTAFALRAVAPYYYENKLIGYVEMGEEINHLLKIMNQETGDEYVFIGEKRNLDKAEWEKIKKTQNIPVGWDFIEEHAVLGSTGNLSDEMSATLKPDFIKAVETKGLVAGEKTIKSGENFLVPGGFILEGAGSQHVGMVLTLHEISDTLSLLGQFRKNFTVSLFFIAVLTFAIAAGFFSMQILKPLNKIKMAAEKIVAGDYNQKIDSRGGSEIRALAEAFNSMTSAINRTIDTVDAKVREKTAELKSKIDELEKFQKLAVGRELKMIELKKEVDRLKGGKNEGEEKND